MHQDISIHQTPGKKNEKSQTILSNLVQLNESYELLPLFTDETSGYIRGTPTKYSCYSEIRKIVTAVPFKQTPVSFRFSESSITNDYSLKEPNSAMQEPSYLKFINETEKFTTKTDGILSFEVDQTDSGEVNKIFNYNEVYRNFSQPKGLVLIINNRKFVYSDERHGTEIDETNIRQLFSKLGYKVLKTRHDLTAANMRIETQRFAKNKEHKLYDSCVVVVLTHGTYDHLMGSDELPVNLNTFRGYFNSINAPLLKGKPKLFFIQACRGNERDVGTDNIYYKNEGPPPSFCSCFRFNWKVSPARSSSSTTKSVSHSLSQSVGRQPVVADMLIAFSTTPNYVSYRHHSRGSWFIESICEVFSKYAKTEDIGSLLTRVNRRVAKQSTGKGYKQQPEINTCLQKKFYFFPGVHSV